MVKFKSELIIIHLSKQLLCLQYVLCYVHHFYKFITNVCVCLSLLCGKIQIRIYHYLPFKTASVLTKTHTYVFFPVLLCMLISYARCNVILDVTSSEKKIGVNHTLLSVTLLFSVVPYQMS